MPYNNYYFYIRGFRQDDGFDDLSIFEENVPLAYINRLLTIFRTAYCRHHLVGLVAIPHTSDRQDAASLTILSHPSQPLGSRYSRSKCTHQKCRHYETPYFISVEKYMVSASSGPLSLCVILITPW